MKKIFMLVLMALPLFAATSCSSSDDDKDEPNLSLDGDWTSLSNDVRVSGSTAKFTAIRTGGWADAVEQGFMEVGDLRFKDIVKIKDFEWSCSIFTIYYNETDRIVTGTTWTEDCTITLSADGKSFTAKGLLPNASGTGMKEESVVYTRN